MTAISHRAAVLGSPIEHSLSPVLHNAGYETRGLSDWAYGRQECTAEELPALVRQADASYAGFSVTMPAKFAALEFADEVTDRARLIGSANTLVRTPAGWRADNTDSEGVLGAVHELFDARVTDLNGARAVVVGGGGTARPAMWALAQLGVTDVTLLNRSNRLAELTPLAQELGLSLDYIPLGGEWSDAVARASVIVSTVPSSVIAGREAELAQAPILDVIYDPWPTPLVQAAREAGHPSVGGHVMLACQAYSQFEQFTGHAAPREEMRSALFAALDM